MKKLLLTILSVILSIVLYSQNDNKLTLEDFCRKYTFRQESVYGIISMNDGIHYTTLDNNTIVKYSYETGLPVDTLFNLENIHSQFNIKNIYDYTLSDDESKILFYTNAESIYRRSFTADYYIYNIKDKTIVALSDNGRQQLGTLSPKGDKVAFVRENNIFIKDLTNNKETQVTTDGKFNFIINGAPDWVYEEEFEFNKAFTWSPDGTKLAYMRFDESNVKMFNMTMYSGTHPELTENKLYPKNETFKYPKAGEDNSIVTVMVYDINSMKTTSMDIGSETNQYIPNIQWTKKNNILGIIRVNRLQNFMEILFANAETGKSNVVYSEKNKYYIEESNYRNINFTDENNIMFTSEMSGYMQIYQYDIKNNKLQKITNGNWDVKDFLGYNNKSKTVYYSACDETPIQTNIYSIRTDGKKCTRLNLKKGTNEAVFSKEYKYFINYFSNATTPNYVTLQDNTGKLIRVLEDNQKYIEQISHYKYNTREFFSFKTPNGDTLNGYMIKPVDFNDHTKYPVLMTQYSGPGSQEVVDSWSFDYYTYLSQEDFLVVCVDPRGTGGRGEEFKKCTYLQLGKYESDDQISAAKYLQTLSYVDPDNISIWGWSYGGFMVSLCMVKSNVFKAGVAIAPVTNWRYYDNIYTERFMRTPQENPDGYDNNSPITHANDLQGNLLLIQGTADDNVHFQNSIEFAERLVQANKQFDYMVYNNRNHSIYGGNTRMHLYTKITNFLKDKLKNNF